MFNGVYQIDDFIEAVKIYGRNFFRLILPFILFFGLSLGAGFYEPTEVLLIKAITGLILGLFGLFAAGNAVIDTWGAFSGLEFDLSENWKYAWRKFPVLLSSTAIVIVPWLLIFYLFLNFFSFLLFVVLAVYPFFFTYLIPSLLIGENGPLSGIKESFQTSLSNSTRTAVVTYLPCFLVVGLISIEIYSPIVLLIAPAWLVLVTVTYCKSNQCSGPVEDFNQRRST
ncbi:hypothetical protein KGY79_01900 [Candidatus Bipolaricaulota bacterium]|nr:hypothetical protein [Candidatus Bipolaricaulota bacterium]